MSNQHSIDSSDYNLKARACWWITVLLGMLAMLYAVAGVFPLDPLVLAGIAGLMAAVFLAGMRAVTIAGTKTSITSGDVFVFLALLLWGVPAATLVAISEGTAASLRTSRRWTSRLSSPAIMAITTVVSGSLFQWSLEWTRHETLVPSTNTERHERVQIDLSPSLRYDHASLAQRGGQPNEGDSRARLV